MQAARSVSASEAIVRSCESQTAYSSAVREASVAARHWAIQLEPSCTAKRELVLPCSIASGVGVLGRRERKAGLYTGGAVSSLLKSVWGAAMRRSDGGEGSRCVVRLAS